MTKTTKTTKKAAAKAAAAPDVSKLEQERERLVKQIEEAQAREAALAEQIKAAKEREKELVYIKAAKAFEKEARAKGLDVPLTPANMKKLAQFAAELSFQHYLTDKPGTKRETGGKAPKSRTASASAGKQRKPGGQPSAEEPSPDADPAPSGKAQAAAAPLEAAAKAVGDTTAEAVAAPDTIGQEQAARTIVEMRNGVPVMVTAED